MPSDLISIGSSGARAARTALDVTSQNIANAATTGYVRRSVGMAEVAAGNLAGSQDASLSGVRISGVVRQADGFRQAEARRTSSDLARADAELTGLQAVEAAVENAGVFNAIVGFEGALQQLAGDTLNPSLRASALERGRTVSSSFNIAATQLENIGNTLRLESADGVSHVNRQMQALADLNVKLVRTQPGSGGQAVLLDQRDALLQSLSETIGISAHISADQSVEIRIGSASGSVLLAGTTVQPISQIVNGDGTIGFAVGGQVANIAAGALAGKAQALTAVAEASARLDLVANALASATNTAQASGADIGGNAGLPMFAGADAKTLTLSITSGSQIATAPAGAGANSLDGSNLALLRSMVTNQGLAGQADSMLFDVSATVAGRKVTQSALSAMAQSASTALNEQSAVDLDKEAADLIRYQQAFQASARIIQVASTIFDTLLAAR